MPEFIVGQPPELVIFPKNSFKDMMMQVEIHCDFQEYCVKNNIQYSGKIITDLI